MRLAFPVVALAMLSVLVGCAGPGGPTGSTTAPLSTIPTTSNTGLREDIPANLRRPAGDGPFPAVVILHDCSGLGPRSSGAPGRWADELVGRGYVVLLPDSFSTRGFAGGVCSDPSPTRGSVGPYRRTRDAEAALAYLRTLPFVDARRIGLMGGSHGGTTTLATIVEPEGVRLAAGPVAGGFAAAIALYPGCALRLGGWRADGSGVFRPRAPTLILIGERDDWTPAEPCRHMTDAARAAGEPVGIRVYPGAHHSFDSPYPVRYVATRMNPNAPGGRGATTGGDAKSWAESVADVTRFFGEHLRGAR